MKRRKKPQPDKKGKPTYKAWCFMMADNFRRVADLTEKYRPEFMSSIPFYLNKAEYYQRMGNRTKG